MGNHLHKHLLLLICALTTTILIAQDQDTLKEYNQLVNSVIKSKSQHYHYLDSIFKEHSRDTLKMKLLHKKSEAHNYKEGQSYALNMIGVVYRDNSLYDKAINAHKSAQVIADEINNIELKVVSLNMLGVVHRRLDLIRSALDYHKNALDLAETIKNPSPDLKFSIAVSQNSMGNIYLALKQYTLAIDLFKKSLEIEIALNNKLGLAINHHNIGFAQEALGDIDSALKNYKTSLSFNEEINSEVGRAICFNSIGKTLIKQGNYTEAEPMINSALEKSLAINDQYYIATSYVNLGWLQTKLNQIPQAKASLEKALNITERYNLKSSEIEAYEHLSELHEITGDYKKAIDYYKTSVAIQETIVNDRNLQYVNDLIIKYDAEKKNNEIKALASENEIVKLKLEQNKKMLLLGLFGLILFAGIILVLSKQRQLKTEKKIITLEQDMLRNQMNPHFIFNSLNSIKLYIINNEKENAVYYLNKFSKLIRKILVASTEKEITLEDELETMALYMNIENIRFSNEIKYNVEIDDNVDIAAVKVPSLILQPFLENSLWHGLSSKSSDKQITVNLKKTHPNFVNISITDNGIGRKASQAIKDQKTLKRKSVGISLTKERLANFSRNYDRVSSIKIKDLYDTEDNAIGTQVIINIPTKKTTLRTA